MRRPQFGIGGRIYAGFGSLLALGLVLTIIAVWALALIHREVAKMDALSEYSARILEISRDFEIMRGTVQRNRLEGDDGTSMRTARHAIESLRTAGRTTGSEELRKIFSDLETAAAQFLERRAALVEITRRAQAERAKLFADGDELTVGGARVFAAARASEDEFDYRSGRKGGYGSASGAHCKLAISGHARGRWTDDLQNQSRQAPAKRLRPGRRPRFPPSFAQ